MLRFTIDFEPKDIMFDNINPWAIIAAGLVA